MVPQPAQNLSVGESAFPHLLQYILDMSFDQSVLQDLEKDPLPTLFSPFGTAFLSPSYTPHFPLDNQPNNRYSNDIALSIA